MNVKIEKLDHFGRGVTHISQKICFVDKALPNEEAEIIIIKEKKNFLEAKIDRLLSSSHDRVISNCPFYDKCGGCSIDHMNYKTENEFKMNKVKELLSRFASSPCVKIFDIAYSEPYNYRNKVILHGNNGNIGLYEDHSNILVPINNCLLLSTRINNMIEILKHYNVSSATIKVSNDDKELLLDVKGKIVSPYDLIKYCDVLYYNDKLLTDKKSIINSIGDVKYYVSRKSFFQVNRFLTKDLYDEVLKIVKDKEPINVLDLYCGTGSIGIYVSKYCKSIIGIDCNEDNICDANNNATLNNINNISFICDKVENRIDSFNNIDLIIVDPPRSGLDNKTKEYISKINPLTVIYVSCDPATLARDLNDLSSIYDISYVKPFNMFPRTSHVETVSVLCRKTIEK